MKRTKIAWVLSAIGVVLVCSAGIYAAFVDPNYRSPDVVSPGQAVTISGTFDPAKPNISAKVFPLGSSDANKAREAKDGKVLSASQVSITLPDNLAPGRYYVQLTYDGATEQVPGELRVETDAVKVDSAHPTTAYKSPSGGFNFDVIGQNFNADALEQNQIYVTGPGAIIKEWSRDKQHCDETPNLPCLWVESSEKLHVIGYKPDPYQGPLSFSVKVGASTSPSKKLTLSRMSETGVLVFTVIVFLVLGYIVYRLVASGIRDTIIDGKRYSPFSAFFLDKQSNSYSLSKFQLLAFFSVFVFGYLYVFLCRWLVQWQFVLPDVPSSFSAILAMSAGTNLAAASVTASRGSKGAGAAAPSPGDFITTGGQVVPERFQFLVWTLIACSGFLALLISQDPATIEKFPSFPDGLLYVMGISATGYLGGKLMRSAGPVIRNIAWDTLNSKIIVQGENLSKNADFFIEGKKLDIQPTAKDKLVEATPQEQQGPDGSFSSELKIKIEDSQLDLDTGEHNFRLMNKDGQFADARFTADPPMITSVLSEPPAGAGAPDPQKAIQKGTSEVKVTVKGSGFRQSTIAKWKSPNAEDATELASSSVTFVDTKNMELMLVPGDPGSGSLILITPNGFSAVATVTVV